MTTLQPLDRRAVTVALVTVAGGLMVVLDVTITNVAIGRLSQVTHAPLSLIQWVSTGYTLALVTVMPLTAWLIDRVGAKRSYLAALTVFVAGSVLTGLAWNVTAIIAFRVLQGLGGGLIVPLGMAMTLRLTEPEQRGRITGITGLPVLIGPVVGPTLGGWLLDALSWRWIFFVNAPVGLLALALAVRLLPTERPDPSRRLDLPGFLLLPPGLAVLIYGLSVHNGLWAGLGLLLVGAFAVRALTAPHPLIDVRLFRLRPMASTGLTLALFAAYFGSMFLLPLYYQVVRGQSAAASGLLIIPQAVATGVSMQVASRLVDRISATRITRTGLGLTVAGLLAFTLLLGTDSPYPALLAATAVIGAGVGTTMLPSLAAATRHLARESLASGSTLLNLTNQVAVSFGTAMTSILLGSRLADRVGRSGVGSLYGLPAAARRRIAPDVVAAFHTTLLLPLGLTVAALAVAVALPIRAGNTRSSERRATPVR